MGAYSRRQLRVAFSFVIRPLLLAVFLTVMVRLLFAPSKPNHSNSASGEVKQVHGVEQLESNPQPPPKSPSKAPYKGPSKHLVIASTSKQPQKEIGWISEVPTDWKVFNYVTDAPTSPELAVPVNKGNEAMVYLTYIIDHYDTLPDVVFFHHSHLRAWHQESDSLTEVKKLRASYVQKKGFASGRCLPGCENIIPLADYTVDFDKFKRAGRDAQLTSLLFEFLDKGAGELVPLKLAAPCCAQFAASREAIRGRSRNWWVRLRQWLIDTPLNSQSSGRLLEHTWHLFLGETAEYCPNYNACKCHVFGIGACHGFFEMEKSM